MNTANAVPAQGTQTVETATAKLHSSNTHEKPDFNQHIDRNPNINDRNLMGFCILFGFFVGGLISSSVISAKIISLVPFVLPASVFIWALTYPCSDIAGEVYGKKYANKLVIGGYVAYIMMFLIIAEALMMTPAPFWGHQEAFETVLGSNLRIIATVLISYGVTQFFDVQIFAHIRRKSKGKHLWLRNNLSTLMSQTLANTIFLTLGFLGTIPMEKWWALFTANLMARYCLAFVDTTIVYTAVHALYKLYPELKAQKPS